MRKRVRAQILVLMSAGFLLAASTAMAKTVADLQNVKVLSHHFAIAISNPIRTFYTKDPSKSRIIVLKVSATAPKGSVQIYNTDFVLVYSHRNGDEDRAQCDAVGTADTADPGDFSRFAIGQVVSIKLNQGKVYFGLAFMIEPDVESVELYRIGTAETFQYRVGSDRQYSVYMTTNSSMKWLSEVKEAIEAGNYYVHISDGLVKEETGVTIHYSERAETQAREVSQRLMSKLGITTRMKKLDLASEYDIVVWLGQP